MLELSSTKMASDQLAIINVGESQYSIVDSSRASSRVSLTHPPV